jgi:TM2 domain-containing membrane protein YozV|tara:strand:- start:648 stop:995 length:348 start_codon:yes stop_codon:yes gene_type:complete
MQPNPQQIPIQTQYTAPQMGIPVAGTPMGMHQVAVVSPHQQKSKMAVLLLGIFLGAFGAHNFYLSHTGKAVAQLLITVLSLGILSFVSWIWAIVEVIMIFTSLTPVDAMGVPLRD